MLLKERMNKLNQLSSFVRSVADALQIEVDNQNQRVYELSANQFFDTCTEEMLSKYESEAGIIPLSTQSLDDRRSTLIAKWKSEGKSDITLLRTIADSWQYGKTAIDYVDNVIVVSFVDKGIPTDLDSLKNALESAKPAHLPIEYIFVYNTWQDISNMTWAEASAYTWEQLMVR